MTIFFSFFFFLKKIMYADIYIYIYLVTFDSYLSISLFLH